MRGRLVPVGLAVTLGVTLAVGGCSSATGSSSPSASTSPSPAPRVAATAARPRTCQVGRYLGRGSVVSAIGDSYTSGGGKNRWPALIAARNGWTVHVDAADGSGYMIGGFTGKDYTGPRFPDQVRKLAAQHPDLVVIMGSRNDIGHTDYPYLKVVADTLAAIRRAVPRTPILVVNSFWTDAHPPASMTYIRDVLRSSTSKVRCASFLDPLVQGWFSGDNSRLIGPDGEHPTAAGLHYLADRLQRTFVRLGYR